MKTKSIIAASLLVLTTSLSEAACVSHFFDEQPSIPNGRIATKAQMLVAQEQVKAYIRMAEKDIHCVRNDFSHDTGVRRLRELSQRYNEALRQHQAVSELVTR